MSFRARLTFVAAVAVAIAVALASLLVYFIVRSELRGRVDDGLRARAALVSRIDFRPRRAPPDGLRPDSIFFGQIPEPELGGPGGYIQIVPASGALLRRPGEEVPLPAGDDVRAVAAGQTGPFFADADVAGTHVRVLTVPFARGYAMQIARPLTEVDSTLSRIRKLLLLVAATGVGIAAILGLVVARTALTPVRRLTETTEHVTRTGDLKSRIEGHGRDELGRLATSFNTMLGALEESARVQRQLVADASHELRTPLTSLRTNIEVLARDKSMAAEERERLLVDVVEQLMEMTALVSELVELARGDEQQLEAEPVRLDLVTADAIERTKRNRPGVRFRADLEHSLVHGVPSTIERAVSNLLDNAGKWSPPGGEVEVIVRDGQVIVRDHGPGIDDEDLPHVFDRFYRAPAARGMPGSGLGLAIVRQVAMAHGGTVTAERAEGGGTRVCLSLPEGNGGEPP